MQHSVQWYAGTALPGAAAVQQRGVSLDYPSFAVGFGMEWSMMMMIDPKLDKWPMRLRFDIVLYDIISESTDSI